MFMHAKKNWEHRMSSIPAFLAVNPGTLDLLESVFITPSESRWDMAEVPVGGIEP